VGAGSGAAAKGGGSAALAPLARHARWVVVDWMPVELAPGNVRVNSVLVPPPDAIKLLYHTDLREAYLHHRIKGGRGAGGAGGGWTTTRLYHQPDCRGLMVADILLPHANAVLEFSITGRGGGGGGSGEDSGSGSDDPGIWSDDDSSGSGNGDGSSWREGGANGDGSGSSGKGVVRDPAGSPDAVYTAAGAGVWRLKGHTLSRDEAGQLAPLMLVRGGARPRCALCAVCCAWCAVGGWRCGGSAGACSAGAWCSRDTCTHAHADALAPLRARARPPAVHGPGRHAHRGPGGRQRVGARRRCEHAAGGVLLWHLPGTRWRRAGVQHGTLHRAGGGPAAEKGGHHAAGEEWVGVRVRVGLCFGRGADGCRWRVLAEA
jgi:hypothetical protein